MDKKGLRDIIGYLDMASSCIKRCRELLENKDKPLDLTNSDAD